MHYTYGDMYFYSKGDFSPKAGFEMAAHIEACSECSEKLQRISAISSIINSKQNVPPALAELLSRKRARTFFIAPFFTGSRFAVAATLVFAVSAALFFGRNHVSKDKEIDFVYKTYASIYDYDYYNSNYMDDYSITFSGGSR